MSLFFFIPNGNSKLIYNSISPSQIEASYPIEKGNAKKKKRQRKRFRKAKLRKQKGIDQSNFFDEEWTIVLSAIVSSLMVVLGAIFFAMGIGSILFLVLGIVLIPLGLAALYLTGILAYREAVTGLAIGMTFLVGLFFLIFGLIFGLIAVWIIGIVITGIIGFIGLGFIVNMIITGSYG